MTSPPPTTTTTTTTTNNNPNPITIRLPSKYARREDTTTPFFRPPPLPFLHRTWTVTHSTLRMWRAARNVRITYGPLEPNKKLAARMSDLVEYESLSASSSNNNKSNAVKRIAGVDTAAIAGSVDDGHGGGGDISAWDWRGSGLLFFVTSRWEVLGWGEREVPAGEGEGGGGGGREVERWVVTWFAPTLFTAEGVDVYSDRRQGGSEGLVAEVLAELGRVTAGKGKLGELVAREMREVAISSPWKER